ncbi:helix-turn-helix transcriptional regulator [Tissierella sp. Yu-01]|uniref:helix-turn-helix domain-containing protein n=1 Tax=Tissierella sp. Yu-01 TaxID=3035694 RepID=UPI00240D3199|nr:helix-turn-helix transcriptional regulator [Tissierella sp. Yu-01]WFA08281.1 helix-turn-helix transcriptional regulator [Tissierella sp. Yu-01]
MLNGLKIRELRTLKGYTTLDLSKFTRISKSYLEELERGDKINPSFDKVVYIAHALGVKVDELILKV